jgi:hypothetical protein
MVLNNFTIPDDLFIIYRDEAMSRKISLGDLLRERLQKAVGCDPREHPLILTGGRTMQQIEGHLGGGQLKSAEDLLKKVRRLASIKFGAHEFVLSPGQLEELTFRAAKTGRSIDRLIAEIWRRVSEDFFKYVP